MSQAGVGAVELVDPPPSSGWALPRDQFLFVSQVNHSQQLSPCLLHSSCAFY